MKAVFFDLDDTLLDHAGASRRGIDELHESSPFAEWMKRDEFVAHWLEQSEIFMKRYIQGELSFQAQRIQRVKAVANIAGRTISDSAAGAFFQQYISSYEKNWKLFDDVLPCFAKLASYRLGIISNGDSKQQRQKIQALGLDKLCSVIVISSEVKISKPDPSIFLKACEMGEVNPADTTYIGDRHDLDAEAATRAGLKGIWLNRNGVEVGTKATALGSLQDLSLS